MGPFPLCPPHRACSGRSRIGYYILCRFVKKKKKKKMMAGGTMDCSTGRQRSQWSDLPEVLLQLISNKLTDVADYVRFRAVCTSWRSAAIPSNLGPQVPWLLLPRNSSSRIFSFLSLTSKRVYNLDLPEIQGKVVVGLSHGWLVIIDNLPGTSIFLFNPLTRSQIQLPPTAQLPREDRYGDVSAAKCAALSSSPSSGDCIVVVVTYASLRFAFCRPGDRAWTKLHSTLPIYINMIAFHKQRLYIIDFDGNTAIWDASQASRPTLIPSLKVPAAHKKHYLMNTSGHELLLVARRVRELDYSVLKLDQLKWSMVERIGQNTLFLSSKHCFCISTSSSGCAPDCIYVASGYQDQEELDLKPFDYIYDISRKSVVKDEISDLISRIWKNHELRKYWLNEAQWFFPALN